MPPTERAILCGGTPATQLPVGDPAPVRLDLFGSAPNVRLRVQDVRRELVREVPAPFLDLLDLAAYVYAADQSVGRGGPRAAEPGAVWRRRLFFRVPVRMPDLWTAPETVRLLTDVLGFLTDDEYLFDFRPLASGPLIQRYLDFGTTPHTGAIDDVVMFSGGVDSLGGAVAEAVTAASRVLLLHHRSTGKLAPRHDELVSQLAARAGAAAPVHVPVWANKSEGLTKDYTQRSRSFLFAALGATVATMVGRDRLRFYENGVLSFNLPISAQVVGGRASRTTHPRVLGGIAALVRHLSGRPFAIENPFQWSTKTDVVAGIADAGCGDLLGLTVSCAHTRRQSREQPHCGVCSQCVDRRFAVLAAGQGAADPAEGYGVDLLTGPREDEESRLLLAGYLETVNRTVRADPMQFLDDFGGEVGQVVRRIAGLTADEAGRRVFELYKRHAGQVAGVVRDAIQARAADLFARTLPTTCLVRQVLGDETPRPAANGLAADLPGEAANCFCWCGEAWVVRFDGGERKVLLPSRGATYLHRLLSTPGRTFPALALACAALGHDRQYVPPPGVERLDAKGFDVLRTRYEELQRDMAAAEQAEDTTVIEDIKAEISALAAELHRAKGLGQRRRRDDDVAEKARKAVGNAVRRTLKSLRKTLPPLADHFRPPHLAIGVALNYRPPAGLSWQV